ncbi:hypothetical protein V496_01705 [Pseudogymnoascus sp. VKM F-4515 (FW-2607)]|nr:hypothetical protein V496_01705 [Pseudogymnoascus sp. VKM F-4515 (FW-2607)]
MATNAELTNESLRHRAGVRRGISECVANDVREQIIRVSAVPYYKQEEAPEYPFEALDSNIIKGTVKKLIDDWFKDGVDTNRFGAKGAPVLKSWAVIRTVDVTSPKRMDGLFLKEDESGREIATFIALGPWNDSNGIFTLEKWTEDISHSGEGSEEKLLSYIRLESGEDISL